MDHCPGAIKLTRVAVDAALADYLRSPGKYQVHLRHPAALFSALKEILHAAVGRDTDAASGPIDPPALNVSAARFFIRTALLYPGADHYALLGLDRGAEGTAIKDRYRLMMRLLHPDFSGTEGGDWPPDAAVRVNLAYDTLSSAVQRRAYDEQLASHPEPLPVSPEIRRAAPSFRVADREVRQSWFKKLAAGCALAGIALAIWGLIANGSSDAVHLVQRTDVVAERLPQLAQELALSQVAAPLTLQQSERPKTVPVVHVLAKAAPAAPKESDEPRISPYQAPSLSLAQRIQDSFNLAIPSAARPKLPLTPTEAVAERTTIVSRESEPVPDRASVLPAPSAPLETRSEPNVAPIPLASSARPQVALAVPAAHSVQPAPAPAPRPAIRSGPTLVDAQPLLSQLLLLMEGGRGERILNLLEPDARSKPSAQALSRNYDLLVDGARMVRLSHVEFKAEPGEGRLLVVGQFRVVTGDQTIGSLGKKMVVRAEFVSREGNVVITGLSGGPAN